MRLLASVFILGLAHGSAAWGKPPEPSALPASDQPTVFAPGIISTGDSETSLELSPDGKTAYLLRNAPNFAFWTIYEPYITPKGDLLIFMAVGRDGKQQGDFFISFLRSGAWTLAKLLGPPISSPSGKEYALKLAPDGKLFLFSSTRSDWKPGLARRLTTREYEEKLHSPGNGLGDIYSVDARLLPTEP